MSNASHTLGRRIRPASPVAKRFTPAVSRTSVATSVVQRPSVVARPKPPPVKAPPTLGKRKVLPPPAVLGGTPGASLGKKKKSPVVAPDGASDAVPPDAGPETMSPADTVPAADPYATDASWTPFPDDDDGTGAADLDDVTAGGVGDVPDFDVEIGPAVIEPPKMPEPTPPATVTAPKLGWFDRILAWFGLARHKVSQAVIAGEAASMATMSQSEAAAQLVRRARNGDQNAMAMIACVREAAAKGNAKAIISAKFMRNYIEQHPVDESGTFGIDEVIPRKAPRPSDPATAAAMALSHGPPLTNPRIGEFIKAARFGEEEVKSFYHGFHGRRMRNPDEKIQKANQAGWLVAHARKLQLVRLPHTSISKKFDANIGWELGEDIE